MKIVIIGNAGSGKSFLADYLSKSFGISLVSLDDIFWEPGGYNIKRPRDEVYKEIRNLINLESWIVEGVFGDLAALFLETADRLIWLDLDWKMCKESLIKRGSQSSVQGDQKKAELNFELLLQWASEYWSRDGWCSIKGHSQLFENFAKEKVKFRERAEVNKYICKPVGANNSCHTTSYKAQ